MSHYWSACLFFKGASFFLTAFILNCLLLLVEFKLRETHFFLSHHMPYRWKSHVGTSKNWVWERTDWFAVYIQVFSILSTDCMDCLWRNLGPLYMNLVDSWAGSVSTILPYCEIPGKYLMCSYQRAGWLSSQDLCFSISDLGKRAGKFCLMHTSAWLKDESGVNLAARMASSWFACCIFHIISILFSHKSCQSYDRLEYSFVFCHVYSVSWISCHNPQS